MSIFKEELTAGISLAMTVTEADGVLEKGQAVVINDDYQVTTSLAVSGGPVLILGYVIIPNREAGGKATIFFKARSVQKLTAYEAFTAGQLLAFTDNNAKVSKAGMQYASGQINVLDFAWDGTETLTIDTTVLTVGVDFVTGASNNATARNIASEINLRVPKVKATVNGSTVNLRALDIGENNIALATNDTGADVTVSGATLTGADVSAVFAYGIALQEATAPDGEADVLVF